jgi:hypothetical protein
MSSTKKTSVHSSPESSLPEVGAAVVAGAAVAMVVVVAVAEAAEALVVVVFVAAAGRVDLFGGAAEFC